MYKAVSKSIDRVKRLIPNRRRPGVTETLPGIFIPSSAPVAQESLAQIERLVSSHLLQGSETLCKLLSYLAHHTLNNPTDHLKEYQIATEVLGRGPDFDPQSDASVRVQVGRLRNKLSEYYNSAAGGRDRILVDIPKGRYALVFEHRVIAPASKAPEAQTDPVSSTPQTKSAPRHRAVIWGLLAVLAGITLGVAGTSFMLSRNAASSAFRKTSDPVPPALQTFWTPFLRGPAEPFVIFSNAEFVGDAETGMRYFDKSRDSYAQMSQHYTGVGEVMGVLELDRLFRQFGSQFRIKRVSLFTFDDAVNSNLIFVGSPTENLSLREIPNTRDFVFKRVPEGQNHWNQIIIDLHPQPGLPATYQPTPRGQSLQEDYAVISLLHGIDRTRWTLILAGTTTIGTQAAVDYVCDHASIEELLRRLHISKGEDLKSFEALVRVKVANDVPIGTELLVLRPTNN